MASANITFDTIPASIRKPGKYIEFNTKLAVRTLPGNLQRTLIVGQRIASGALPANTVVDIFSDVQAAIYFGYGSIAHLMCMAALKANRYISLQAIALDDAIAGVAATKTVTLTGPATSQGVITVNVGNQAAQIAVAVGDTATVMAAALKTQFDNQPNLPMTAAAALGVLTLTAKCKGTLGSLTKVSATALAGSAPISGVTVAVADGVAGATDPTMATALATVFSGGHNIIISAWNDQANLTALRTHLDSVSGALEQRGAVGVYGHVGTLSQATTLAGLINSGRTTCALLPNAFDNSYELAAAYGAEIAFEEDPARPLNTLPLTGILPNPQANRLGRTEQEVCLYNGITPLEVGPGDVVQIVRAVTTYTLDPQGIPDPALLDLPTIRTLDYTRKACRERIALRFPRDKLSKRTPGKVRTQLIDVLHKLEELEILENVDDNLPGLLVERDLQDSNRLDSKIPSDVVNGLHIFAAVIDLLL